jgi:transcription antitermination protein NusB
MTRREQREQVFKLLFRAEFHDSEAMEEQKDFFCTENDEMDPASEKETTYITEKAKAILDQKEEIDQAIDRVVTGWKTNRMGKVELSILRLAYYEMKYEESVPSSVAINEAVELAKSYGQEEAASFVNGVLAKLV